MWIVALALRRPYTFIVMALLILILSPIAITRTPVDILPEINIPVISVVWQYEGLSAQEMTDRIVSNTERGFTTLVNDIEHIETQVMDGRAIEKVFLQPTANLQTPIMQVGIRSNSIPEQQLFDYSINFIRPQLTTVRGASIPWPYGGKQRLVAVDIDTAALQAKGLTPVDVVNAVNAQNLILPTGLAKMGTLQYAVGMNGSPDTITELNNLPIKTVNGATTYIRDVAQVRDGFSPQTNMVRQDGVRGTLITIMRNGGTSTLDIVANIREKLAKVARTVPEDLDIRPMFDQSLFVRAAIQGVLREALTAACLTAAMILLFLGNWRTTLVIAISIPLSILCSIITLGALGQTFNLMTLGGLALAVGILVDDATVEIENIDRNLGMKKELKQAILDGAQQIAVPAFVSTLSICIVFVPMFFLTGVARYLFVPMAEAVVFAMLASYLLSRTLVPTMVMYLLRNHEHESHQSGKGSGGVFGFLKRLQQGFEDRFARLRDGYHNTLAYCLHHRRIFITSFLFFCVASVSLVFFLGEDFFPSVDAGIFRLHVRGRAGLRIEETARLCDEIENVLRQKIPKEELVTILDNLGLAYSSINNSYSTSGTIGTSDAEILVSLNQEHHHPTEEYVKRLRE